MKFKIISFIVRLITPVIIFGTYYYFWETQYNIDGLWIYCGCLSFLHWQGFLGHIDHVKKIFGENSLSKRIELLEVKIMGEVMEESYDGMMDKANLKKGLAARVDELENKIA